MVAPIELPVALFQKPRNTVRGDSVETAHMPLGLPLHVLNSVDRMTYLLTNMLPCLIYSTQRVCCLALSDIGCHERDGQIGSDLKGED